MTQNRRKVPEIAAETDGPAEKIVSIYYQLFFTIIIIVNVDTTAAKEGKFSRYDATGNRIFQVRTSLRRLTA